MQKTIKKIFALILALTMITVFPFTANAGEDHMEKRLWTDGEKYSLSLPNNFTVNGEAKLEFMLPFYSDYVVIESSTPNVTIGFEIDGVKHEINLSGASTKFTFPDVLRRGEKDLYITGNAKISAITFNEIMEEICFDPIPLNTSDYEDATQTALIIRENSPILKSKTAVRYYDYNNLNVKPLYYNGALYVPADALCLALEIYWEQDTAKDFFVLRKDETEVFHVDGVTKIGVNNKYSLYDLDVQNFYGKAYLPLRQIAELFGNYVLYKDGFIIVDYRSRARAIFDNFYSELKAEFDNYMPTGETGKTWYVAQTANASDDNDGSEARPFATIARASEVATAGDTILIGEGTYHETIIPKNDGMPTKPITYKAKEGEDVKLSSTEVINQFTEYKDGILVASIPNDMGDGKNQVFYKHENLVEARYPNKEIGEDGLFQYSTGLRLNPIWLTEGAIWVDNKDKMKAYSETLLQEDEEDYWKGATYICENAYAWTLTMAKVGSSKKGELTFSKTSTKWWWAGTGGLGESISKGYLTDHINCIDVPGEWYISKNMIYIMPPEGETAETLELEVKKDQLLIDLNDRSYIHIDGLKTFGGGIRMNNSTMCVLNNCDMQYLSKYTFIDDQRNLYDDGNVMNPNGSPQRGEMGIYVNGEHNAIVNSNIQYSAGAGIILYGSYAFVNNNTIYDTAYGGTSLGGITMDTEAFNPMSTKRGGHTITHNTVSRTARQAFAVNRTEGYGWTTPMFLPSEIAYNDFSSASICTLDTGTIYMWGSDLGDPLQTTRIHNNFTYEVAEKGTALLGGIYNDNIMRGTESFDNVMFSKREGQYLYSVPFEQKKAGFPNTYATVDSWNNTDLGVFENAKDDLTINDFPSGKPFNVGSTLANDFHDMTYEYYKNNAKVEGIYNIEDMILSDGIEIENNLARFTSLDQSIKIENVDFEKFNRINITYTSDYYKTDDDFVKVVVGDSLDDPLYEKTIQLRPEAKFENDFNIQFKMLGTPSEGLGKQTVWIVPDQDYDSYGNSAIASIQFSHQYATVENYVYDHLRIPAGMFTSAGKGKDPQAEDAPQSQMRNQEYMVKGTWGSNWVLYKKVNIGMPCNTLNIGIGSGGKWLGNTVKLRVDSVDGPVLAEMKVTEDTSWAEKVYTLKLSETLLPGTYDIYFTFEGSGLCSDFYWFGLNN